MTVKFKKDQIKQWWRTETQFQIMKDETGKIHGKNMHEIWNKTEATLQDKQLNETISSSKWSSFQCSRNYLYWYLETPTSVNQNLSWHHGHQPETGSLHPSGRGTLQVPNLQRQLKEVEVVDVWISVLKRRCFLWGSNFSSFSNPGHPWGARYVFGVLVSNHHYYFSSKAESGSN